MIRAYRKRKPNMLRNGNYSIKPGDLYFAMFTKLGSEKVNDIFRRVKKRKTLDSAFKAALKSLRTLSKKKKFSEALDTAVTEKMYLSLKKYFDS